MPANLRIQPFDEVIQCGHDETILAAVLREKLFIRYGCKGGGCGTCKVLLVDGDVDEPGTSFALSAAERNKGFILACSSVPVEDCTIDVDGMDLSDEEFHAGDVTATYDATLEVLEPLTHDIRFLRLRLDRPMPFTAGQFVNVFPPGAGSSRSYSMANSPSDPGIIDLILKVIPNGFFSTYLGESARCGDRLKVEGPFGLLKIRLSHRKVLMIAGGSGMAPILSMATDLAEKGNDRPVTLFFGARREGDLYLLDRIQQIAERMPLEFIPALSEAWPEDWWGETGMVTSAIARRLPDLEGYDAYLCGPPPMIDAAIPLLVDSGVRDRNIYFDAFVPSGG
jgi:NAD(P)H-flavin reductase/ferredoxin